MNKESYEEIVKKHKPKEDKFRNCIVAFFVGGLLGVIGNFLVNLYSSFGVPTSYAGVFMIITLIFLACLFTALGFFDTFVKWARMGLIIPITGFAHSVQSAALDHKKEGLIYGLGSNIFNLAGSVILYGVLSAYFFGLIRFLIGG